jgi:hypothetical protein
MASTKAIDTYVARAQSGEFAAVFLPGTHIFDYFYNCNANAIVYVYSIYLCIPICDHVCLFILISMKICI